MRSAELLLYFHFLLLHHNLLRHQARPALANEKRLWPVVRGTGHARSTANTHQNGYTTTTPNH